MLFSKLRGRKKTPVENTAAPSATPKTQSEMPDLPRARRQSRNSVPTKKRIGELLLEQELIDTRQLRAALTLHEATGRKLVACIMDLGFIDGETFERFLSKQPALASIDLEHYTIPLELLDLIPREFAVQYQLVPLDKMGRMLTVGMACPLDSATLEKLEEMTGLRVSPMLCSIAEVDACIRAHYPPEC